MLDRFHPPVEEYLETIFALEEEGITVIQARLAERLGKAAPSVSEMLDRLESDGLIERSARQITMTPTGRGARPRAWCASTGSPSGCSSTSSGSTGTRHTSRPAAGST